jgi:hypothetical protein
MEDDYPYHECKSCKDLGDCPCADIDDDGLGSPMCPDNCPKPILVMKATLKKKKQLRKQIKEN